MLKYKMPSSVAREFVQLAIPKQALFISVEIDKNGDGNIFMHEGIATTFIGAIPRFSENHDFIKSHLDKIEVIESTRGAAKSFRFYHKHRLMLEYISEIDKRDMTAELEHLIEKRYFELKKKA